jgi:hypothetical protein
MITWFRLIPITLSAMPVLSAVADETANGNFFDNRVAPILAAHCLDCHSAPEPKAGLVLNHGNGLIQGGESGAAIDSADPEASLLWQMIAGDEMPPKEPLNDLEKKVILDWIRSGAKWGNSPIDPFRYSSSKRAGYDWWSLQPLTTRHGTNFRPFTNQASINPIDRFIAQRLANDGIKPTRRAEPRVLVRRLYFDLLGLPAPPAVIDRFAADPTSESWRMLVNELLDSPHYGERWARHWMDVVRFGETNGFEYNEQREHAWHYRDWVIRALNDDMPYNRFAKLQLAGDIMADDSVEGAAAVGFLVAGVHNTVLGKSDAMKQTSRHEELEDIAGTTSQTFLGLTVNCARCHDHKFDPISTNEYYQFIAALEGVGFGTQQIPKSGEAQKKQALNETQQALASELASLFSQRSNTINQSTNVITLRNPISANKVETQYTVAFEVAPTTWADTTQATTDEDAVVVRILRSDQSVLATHTVHPRPWDIESDDHRFERVTFSYIGDGSGPVKIQIRPKHATTRFSGAVDNLSISGPNDQVVFADNFDGIDNLHPPGVQATTKKPVFFGSSSNAWIHAGGNAIHAVEISEGNLALQLYSGEAGRTDVIPETELEKSAVNRLRSTEQQLATLTSITMHTVNAGSPGTMHVRRRGDVTQLGEAVAPGGLKSIAGVSASFEIPADAPDALRRRRLADWITDRDNGLFHRVIVNRVWYHHFGSAIVDTPNDFGFNAGQASHPELLDWLAIWFRENGYSIKELHRLIVSSTTYQQSSSPTDNPTQELARQSDQSNRLLWRYNLRRADSEYVRDSMLEVAGVLNRRQFGPGFKDVRIESVGSAKYYVAIDPIGKEFNRRTIYRWQARGERSSLLETFDCPDPSTTTPKRNVTTTPTQALSQWNHPFVIRMATALANRVENETGQEAAISKKIDRAWRLVLGRAPQNQEREQSIRTANQHGLPLLCRVLLNSNESIIIE